MPRRLVSRKAAGLPAPKRPRTPISDPRGIALHYSGSLGDAHADHSRCDDVIRAWYRHHTGPGGLGVPQGGADIAYTWAICPHGFRYVLRGRRWRSGANGTAEGNRTFYACCVMGGDKAGRRDVTPLAREALLDLFGQIGREIPTVRQVRPHSAFVGTSCPGDELRAMIPRLAAALRDTT